jgi:hypothetical protein
MSWEQALRDAEKWLVSVGVPAGKIKGQHFYLNDRPEGLPEKEGYRIMVLRAAKRLLEKRGATAYLPDVDQGGVSEEQ